MATKEADEPHSNSSPNMIERASDCVNGHIQRFFYAVGKQVGERPWWFVVGSIVFALLCCSGNANFYSEKDPNKLWVPDDTTAQSDYDWVKSRFGSELRFEFFDITCNSGNCLTPSNLDTALALSNAVSALNASFDSQMYDFNRLCYKRGTVCFRSNILEVFNYDSSQWATQSLIDAKVNSATLTDTAGYTVNLNDMVGGFTYNSTGGVVGAKAMKMAWYLTNDLQTVSGGDDDGKQKDQKAEAWEELFLKVPDTAYADFTIYKLSMRSFSDEFGAAIQADLIMVNVSMLMLILYCSIMIGQCRRGKTRVALSVLGVLTVGLAIGGSMGICSAMNLFYSPLASVLPFLLLGLGVDDMFVIAISYDLTDSSLPIPERLGRSLSHAGASITVTSLTDFLAFCIGGTTTLPALRMFCFYAGVGILLILIFQVFLFSAMLAIDERFKASQRNDCLCCCSGCPECCACCPCNGVPVSPDPDVEDPHHAGDAAAPIDGSGQGTGKGDGTGAGQGGLTSQPAVAVPAEEVPHQTNCCGLQVNMLRRFMLSYLGPFVTSPLGAGLVGLVFAVLLGIGIWGAALIKEDSDFRDFMPAGSYVIDFLDIDEKYFTTVGERVGVYTAAVAYPSSHVELTALRTAVAGSNTVVTDTVSSWYHGYNTSNLYTSNDPATWYTNLNEYLQTSGSRYRSDIKFQDNTANGSTSNPIVAARFTMNHRMCDDSTCQVNNMDRLRSTVASVTPALGGDPSPFPFTEQYLNYEQYKTIEEEAQRNIGLAFLAIVIITMLLIPHPCVASLVFLSVVFTIVEVVGFMYHWGLKVDGVTVVMLIVALGLAIDYSAHIGVAYLHSTEQDRPKAVIQALADMGTPVCHGAMSTFIAIVVLAGSKSYVFISFFKQLVLATMLGCAHGMLLLPVLLCLLGPRPRPFSAYEDAKGHSNQELQLDDMAIGKPMQPQAAHKQEAKPEMDGSCCGAVQP